MAATVPNDSTGDYPNFELDFDNGILSHCIYAHVTDVPFLSRTGKFSVLSLNTKSCRKNFVGFICQFKDYLCKYSSISLVETWLTSDYDYLFTISEFNYYNLHHSNYYYYYYYYYIPDCKPQLGELDAKNPKGRQLSKEREPFRKKK